jgi:dihydroorotate dehydrogenase (NAD+) catalytic subunit
LILRQKQEEEMIKLSNGHSFDFMAASGALGYNGKGWAWEKPLRWLNLLDETLFTIVIKTITLYPRKGNLRWYNPFRAVRFLSDGTVNAVGLTNPGIEWWCRKVGPGLDSKKRPLVASIWGESEELSVMARMLNDFDLKGLEINASCPNVGSHSFVVSDKVLRSCEEVKKETRFPIILKLSVVHDFEDIVYRTKDIVEAFSINSVPWARIFPEKESPLFHFGGGGVSGKIAQPLTWKMVKEIAEISDIPVIGPSVWNYEDMNFLRKIGAKAISFGSIFLKHPLRPTLFVRRDKKSSNLE